MKTMLKASGSSSSIAGPRAIARPMPSPNIAGNDEDDAQREMRREVIDDEHLAERDRQMHEPLEVNRLGALQFGEQADHPEKRKRDREAKPDPHDDLPDALPNPRAAPSKPPTKVAAPSTNG